jgi:hypothetical protein
MVHVKVAIQDNDWKLGAMVKALAFEVENTVAVKGATRNQMLMDGHLKFNFTSDSRAAEFREALITYLPAKFAHVID